MMTAQSLSVRENSRCGRPTARAFFRQEEGFTLIELLAVIAIIAILAALVFSGVQQAKSAADRVVCVGNLHTIAAGIISYASDNGGKFPLPHGQGVANGWDGLVIPYISGGTNLNVPCKAFKCPADPRPLIINAGAKQYARSYVLSSQSAGNFTDTDGVVGYTAGNAAGDYARQINQVKDPADTIMVFDYFSGTGITPAAANSLQNTFGGSIAQGWNKSSAPRGYLPDGSERLYHGNWLNYAMVDGHVESRDNTWPYTPHSRWAVIR